MSISAKELSIIGIDDRRYWKHIPTEESSLEINEFHPEDIMPKVSANSQVEAKVEFCFPAKTYSLFFRIQLGWTSKRFGHRVCNTEHVHGWEKKPMHFQLSSSYGQHAPSSQCYLEKPGDWIHYHVAIALPTAPPPCSSISLFPSYHRSASLPPSSQRFVVVSGEVLARKRKGEGGGERTGNKTSHHH
ncbi:hypothetical protein MRB53_014045 [Persea americana]|uniref:Uncharacterized protein n=1 Tax=Persea americana TaxID=3435 RepID=A0ACC2K9P4_PERAE|nr:hypothetical protein MRB53_014045 [Persea americana]